MKNKYAFAVKDYRIIKTAAIKPEGITLIYGRNCNGKSTMIKALVTALSNQFSAANFRHGTEKYSIAARIGESSIFLTREGEQTSVRFNDEPERTKLGRRTLFEIEPRFPLRRVDYNDTSFYPNFSFQNKVPVFDDISVYDLFSSMFASIAQVAQRTGDLKHESTNLNSDVKLTTDLCKKYAANEADASIKVDEFFSTYPNYQTDKEIYESKLPTYHQFQADSEEVKKLEQQVSSEDLKLAVAVNSAEFLDVEESYEIWKQIDKELTNINGIKETLTNVEKEINSIPFTGTIDLFLRNQDLIFKQAEVELLRKEDEKATVEVEQLKLVSSAYRLLLLLTELRKDKQSLEELDNQIQVFNKSIEIKTNILSEYKIWSSVQEVLNLQAQVDRTSEDLSNTEKLFEEIKETLSKLGCPYLALGTCPMEETYGNQSKRI